MAGYRLNRFQLSATFSSLVVNEQRTYMYPLGFNFKFFAKSEVYYFFEFGSSWEIDVPEAKKGNVTGIGISKEFILLNTPISLEINWRNITWENNFSLPFLVSSIRNSFEYSDIGFSIGLILK